MNTESIARQRLRGLLYVLIIVCAAMWSEVKAQHLAQWSTFDVPVYYDSRGAGRDIEADIVYALGMWSNRTDFNLEYRGRTTAPHITGAIVISWDNSIGVAGRAIRSYSLQDGYNVHARILLNPDSIGVFMDNYYRIIAHEIGHAIGIRGHNGPGNIMASSMWTTGDHLTVDDLDMVVMGEVDKCSPELARNNDIWFPAVWDGVKMVSARLIYGDSGAIRWSVGSTHRVDAKCPEIASKGGLLILPRIWSEFGDWYAELLPEGDTFKLWYAE